MSSRFRRLDAFSKVAPDAQIRTSSGGIISITSFVTIFLLIMVEFFSYRKIIVQPELVVDRTRGERMVIHMSIMFPHMSCSRRAKVDV